jgi:hypothetical protein
MEDINLEQMTNELSKIEDFSNTLPKNTSWDDYLSSMDSPLEKVSICIQTANAIHQLLACILLIINQNSPSFYYW